MFKRILVAIDGSEISHRALDFAIDIAHCSDAALRVVHILSDAPSNLNSPDYEPHLVRDALAAQAEALSRRANSLMTARGVRGDTLTVEVGSTESIAIAAAIVESAREYQAQLLVLGTHRRKGVQRLLLGSVAEYCLRTANLPVLLVPRHETDRDSSSR